MDYKGTYIIIGPPGTGKTTFLANQVRALVEKGHRPLVCSLTNAAANEIVGRDIPVPKERVGTLHSLGLHSLGGGRKLAQIGTWNEEHPSHLLSDDERDDVTQTRGKHPWDGFHQQYELCRHRRTPRDLWPRPAREFADIWEHWKVANDYVDFTDMIELALLQQCAPLGDPDIIIADEAADHSRLEYALLKHWGDMVGALMVCGDPHQAIYQWRGADPTIFIDPTVSQDHRRVLKQSYRVPKEVHRVAVEWVKQLSDYQPIEYLPRDFEGKVKRLPAHRNYPVPAINLAQEIVAGGKTVMIMASCEYMLQPTLHELRQRGIPFANPWRPAQGAWNPLARRKGIIMTDRIRALLSPPWTVGDFMAWSGVLSAEAIFNRGGKTALEKLIQTKKITAKDSLTKVMEVIDSDKLIPLGQLLQGGDAQGALDWWAARITGSLKQRAEYPVQVARKKGIKALDDKPKLFVGTIHSYKGGEASIVIIYPDISPQAYECWHHGTVHRDPIIRAFYVALTRAREEVYICQPASPMSVRIQL